MKEFVHLHVHSEYSMLDGMCRLSELADASREMGMPAIAVTDHGGLFGTIPFYNAAKKAGVKPIIGCEFYVAKTHRTARDARSPQDAGYHLILLAQDEIGYRNLMALSTIGYLEGFYYKPRVDKESLQKHREGLIATSACLKGEIPAKILNNDYSGARRVAGEYADIFGINGFFIELQDHGIQEQVKANSELISIARELDLGIVATNDVHFVNRGDSHAHDILLCIQTGKTLSDKSRMRFANDNFYLKTPEEMYALFGETPEALTNTLAIAERCNLDFDFGEYSLPTIEPPTGFTNNQYLRKLAEEGFHNRYPTSPSQNHIDQLNHELVVIEEMGFVDYFLIVWDLVNFARENDIQVGPGRGSGASSIVAYSLGITGVDPIEHKLVFERFLNPERISLPDFDLDFGDRRRDEIFSYIIEKYGADNVAQIITFGTLGARQAVKDVGRVMQVPYGEVDQLSKRIDPMKKLRKNLEENESVKEYYASGGKAKELLDTALRLEGLTRHASVHAAGIVVTPESITKYVPLYRGKSDEQVTQYDMGIVEDIGLLKIDVLGLKTLTIIDDCVKAVKRRYGTELDFDDIDEDNPPTYKMVSRAETDGVFQLESDGMKDLCRRIKPDNFKEMVPILALFRPGPMGAKDAYTNRKQGREKAKAFHPALDRILDDSYGVLLYQEHVLRLAAEIAGYTLGEADILRRAMGKKKKKEMEEQRTKFIAGSRERGMSEKDATAIFEAVTPFAAYGFNKAHTTAYAVLSFQTAYLKANFPVEFMAALLTSEQNNTDKLVHYIKVARSMGLEIQSPDINESWVNFWAVNDTVIRIGMGAIKGLGKSAIGEIIKVRNKEGPFISLSDFCGRVEQRAVNRGSIEALIKAGAFDCLNTGRQPLYVALDGAIEAGKKAYHDRAIGQENLLGGLSETPTAVPETPPYDTEEWPYLDLLGYEKEALGLSLSGHPLEKYRDDIEKFCNAAIDDVLAGRKTGAVTVAGVISRLRTITDRRGREMCFLSIEDEDGTVEVVVFADAYSASEFILFMDKPILVRGKAETKDANPKIIASQIISLDEIELSLAEECHITVRADDAFEEYLDEIKRIAIRYNGKCQLVLHIRKNGKETVVRTAPEYSISPSKTFISTINRLLGKGHVKLQ
ncbi:MAG: DNA polymerase III subunit alpha [bacterium]|nr:DNA polymerase III subunit alpha [bacterium]